MGDIFWNKLELLKYMEVRPTQGEYKRKITLFGSSRTQKMEAAETLKNVLFNNFDPSKLKEHRSALNHGELGSIYKKLEKND